MIPPIKTHSGLKLIVTQPFGEQDSRYSRGYHAGVDLALNGRRDQTFGSEVVAVRDSEVTSVTFTDTMGPKNNWVHLSWISEIDGKVWRAAYVHLSEIIVKVGDRVKQGQTIGYVGNAGEVSPRPTPSEPFKGSHLHFSMSISDNLIDPMNFINLNEALIGEDTGIEKDAVAFSWSFAYIKMRLAEIASKFNVIR